MLSFSTLCLTCIVKFEGVKMSDGSYAIWTIQIGRWRYASDMGVPVVDITVKSGIQAFAPTWENLNAYRAGVMDKREYAQRYYEKVLEGFQQNQQEWAALEVKRDMAFACYCKSGDFCHRHLFAPLYIAYLQSLGRRVQFMGEMDPHPNNIGFYTARPEY